MSARGDYLRHVDGLRALAVLIVIFFHFGISGFTGGYVGVDIFFVISGFLITRILIAEIETTGSFSFLRFYQRRVRRLFPALIFILVLTTMTALIVFAPENLVQHGGALAAAALSVSNILFWFESGYFDSAAHLKPLLHTWSLSVEEQFYLVWPALLLLLRNRLNIATGVTLLAVLSFYLNHHYVSAAEPGFTDTLFFWAPFRGFEFAIGAACVLLEKQLNLSSVVRNAFAIIGLGLIGYSVITLTDTSVFPYINALPPCIGTALIILSGGSLVSRVILENKLAVGIGILSYSLYLAHWPIYSFTRYLLTDVTSVSVILAMLVGSFALASISFFMVEQPFRYAANGWKKRWVFPGSLLGVILLCVLGISLKLSDGLPWRFSSTGLSAVDIEEGKERRFADLGNACSLRKLDNPEYCHMDRPIQMLVFGDSHEPDGYNMFNYLYGDNEQVNIILFGTVNDCQFTVTEQGVASAVTALDCQQRFAALNNPAFINQITHIVYSSHISFEYYKHDLWQVLGNIMARNTAIELIALGGYLQTSIDCSLIRNKEGSFDACKSPEYVIYFNPDELEKTTIPEAKVLDYLYINKFALLCADGQLSSCLTYANDEPFQYDAHHLSYGFARHIGELIGEQYAGELIGLGLPDPRKNTR